MLLNIFVGSGTSHRVNNIILQPGSFNVTNQVLSPPTKKKCRRSLKDVKVPMIKPYKTGKRKGPEPMPLTELEEGEFILADQDKINLIRLLCRKESIPQVIPSWTGFQILIRDKVVVLKSSLGYLDVIDAPATDISTVYHVSFHLQNQLNVFA